MIIKTSKWRNAFVEDQTGHGFSGTVHMYTLPHKHQTDHDKTVVLGSAIVGTLLFPQIPYMLLL